MCPAIAQNDLWRHLKILPGLIDILGPIRAEKVARSMVKSFTEKPLSRFLCGLSIPGVGEQTAKLLAQHFRHMDKLRAASLEELICVPGIGHKTAEDIVSWFSAPQNIGMLDRMRKTMAHYGGSNFVEPDQKGELMGQTFCITGSFEKPRHEIIKFYESKGAIYKSSISAGLDFVLVGADAGSKLAKAEKLGLKIIKEVFFEWVT